MPILSSHASAHPGVSVHIPGGVYVSGCTIEGECELVLHLLQEDDVQEVLIELKGLAKTTIDRGETSSAETIHLADCSVPLWNAGTTSPSSGQDTLRVPFRIQLPPDVPPSFEYHGTVKRAFIRYTLTAICVRPGMMRRNRHVHVPLTVTGKDTLGVATRDKLATISARAEEPPWRVCHAEDKIRKGIWGAYSTVQVDLRMPDVGVFPQFVPIPFIISITSTSAPLARSKADTQPQEDPVFPPVPVTYDHLDFKLRRHVRISARRDHMWHDDSETVMDFRNSLSAAEQDVPGREWVPLQGNGSEARSDAEGVWAQRATFRSTLSLDCPHSFSIKTITCNYTLELKVPFPGIGNDVHIKVPVTVTSGMDRPALQDQLDGDTQIAYEGGKGGFLDD
ncbi:hypothetical protein GY45DRAFT_1431509 [Cubamyces sp. BRFM 1775]|nr:hypothetical protein GY45DRAFT_1431509 [Cubamyces sp. BRFM 1775]